MLFDQPLDRGVHDYWTLFPDFVRDRRPSDFKRFVRRVSGVTGEPRLVPVGPDLPALSGAKESGFQLTPRRAGPIRRAVWPEGLASNFRSSRASNNQFGIVVHGNEAAASSRGPKKGGIRSESIADCVD